MPASSGKHDQVIVELFVKAYENDSWSDADICWLDQEHDGAVEALVTRKNKQQLAIEHTIIQPFMDDKKDFAAFNKAAWTAIESDHSLIRPEHHLTVYVPVGILDNRRPAERDAIISAVREWIRVNGIHVSESLDPLSYDCSIPGTGNVTLTVKCFRTNTPGLQVRRQQVKIDFPEVISKALRSKLPKLAGTYADKRILLLEREHLFGFPSILDEIEKQRPQFPRLAQVDEIWIVETYSPGNVRFELHNVANFAFQDGQLTDRYPLT